ncbi:hypothetical protein KSC_030100 [Ktedonobacter sp. SOSP1-52]|nr:hypothetical protein KSC_030100 [Ktedonobacter sp. SOSP1-52]
MLDGNITMENGCPRYFQKAMSPILLRNLALLPYNVNWATASRSEEREGKSSLEKEERTTLDKSLFSPYTSTNARKQSRP